MKSSTVDSKPTIVLEISQMVHHVLLRSHGSSVGMGSGASIQVPPTIMNLIWEFSIFFSEVMIFKKIRKEKISLSFSRRDLQRDS